MSWKKVKLAELATPKEKGIKGGPFGSKLTTKDYVDDGIPVIRGSNLNGGKYLDESEFVYVTESKFHEDLFSNVANKGDLLFTQRGTLGQVAIIPETSQYQNYVISQSQMKMTVDEDLANPSFIYYYFTSKKAVKEIENLTISSGVPHINLGLLRSFKLNLPSLQEQNEIVSVLSTYDELIQNNKRRIDLLEKSAQLLYKEWFVQLRFPGHEHAKIVDGVPEGWEKKKIKDVIMKVRKPKKVKKGDYLDKGEIPCIDQGQEFIGGYLNDNNAAIPRSDLPLVVFGDHSRTLKYVDFTFAPGADGTQLLRVKGNLFSDQYLYFLLMAVDLSNYFYARHFKFLKEKEFLLPTVSLRKLFEAQAIDVLKQIGLLRQHNQKLTRARDLLLSKLMNGDIPV
ncbi:restriction endonuclease subunit S [Rhodohalobacter sp. SW132]|uniref:restriction endonuclease subunit S n=1 Tax=Rhodohalobacter sp. SW132 TaxID=2293433 RepID=UPI000E2480AB|nr:restriction endonuclease subunit S [Rhodohalobacter sp. SW132]REL24815.1 restriction endonuclease subunit S [Rhodohalobacter sp. SW132]